MCRLVFTFVLCLLFVNGKSQSTIYVAPAPRGYWQQKREDADKALLYQMMLMETAEKSARDAQSTALNKAQQCINDVRNYYTSLSDYPTIITGVHEVHVYDGKYLCQRASVSVSNNKVNWIKGGDGKVFDAKSSDVIKNCKTKAIFDLGGTTYFLDIFFIYEK